MKSVAKACSIVSATLAVVSLTAGLLLASGLTNEASAFVSQIPVQNCTGCAEESDPKDPNDVYCGETVGSSCNVQTEYENCSCGYNNNVCECIAVFDVSQ